MHGPSTAGTLQSLGVEGGREGGSGGREWREGVEGGGREGGRYVKCM